MVNIIKSGSKFGKSWAFIYHLEKTKWYKYNFRYSVLKRDRDFFYFEFFTIGSGFTFSNIIEWSNDYDYTFFLNLWLFGFSISFNLPKKIMNHFKKGLGKYEYSREISISFFNNNLCWDIWVDTNSITDKTSKWKSGNINFKDLILGKDQHNCVIDEECSYRIFTELGEIPVLIQKRNDSWKNRIYRKKIIRFEIWYGHIEDLNNLENKDLNNYNYFRNKGHYTLEWNKDKIDINKPIEVLIEKPLEGASKYKWGSDAIYSGTYYFGKKTKTIDEAYIELMTNILKGKLNYSLSMYKIEK